MIFIVFAIIIIYIFSIYLYRYKKEQTFDKLEGLEKEKELDNSFKCKKLLILSKNKKHNSADFLKLLNDNNINCFYHFTDERNIYNIIDRGGLFSWKYLEDNNIPAYFGSNELSRNLDCRYNLEDYVRLSFCNEHPMMFVAKKEGRIQNPIVLEIDIDVALVETTLFSNVNATKNNVIYGGDIDSLNKVKFDIVKKCYFDLEENEKQYYQAEVLVKTLIPIEYITNIDKFKI